MLHKQHILSAAVFVVLFLGISVGQSPPPTSKTFDQQGLAFEYTACWELGGQPTGEVQQLVLVEKAQDAQIMVIVPRSLITSARDEEAATQSVVEPTIKRLIKQYDDAGIAIEPTEAP